MGLITNTFQRKQKKYFNVQTSIFTNSTHSSIKTKNISAYVILEQDHFDTAAGFQAHHVYKIQSCEGGTKRSINFPFIPTGQ
jgi:hypothetical protein